VESIIISCPIFSSIDIEVKRLQTIVEVPVGHKVDGDGVGLGDDGAVVGVEGAGAGVGLEGAGVGLEGAGVGVVEEVSVTDEVNSARTAFDDETATILREKGLPSVKPLQGAMFPALSPLIAYGATFSILTEFPFTKNCTYAIFDIPLEYPAIIDIEFDDKDIELEGLEIVPITAPDVPETTT
jgi:hypothetical protein